MIAQDTELRRIASALRTWDARLRFQQCGLWLPWGLAGGLFAALLLALAARLWPLFSRERLIAIGAVLATSGAAAALLGVWLRRRDLLAAARRFDRLFGLKERLSTALELSWGRLPDQSPALTAAQRADTLRIIATVHAAQHLPLRTDWRAWGAVLLAAGGLAAALLIPNPQEAVIAHEEAVRQAIAEQIAALEDLREQALTDETLTPEERAAIVEALDRAIETLSQRRISEEEALAALDTAEQDLRDLSEQFAAQRQQALEQASGLFAGETLQDVAAALEAGDLAQAAEALQSLDLGQLTPQQREALGEQLQQAAQALAESNPDLAEALQQAAEALEEGDLAAAQEALEQAGQAMAQAGEEAATSVEGYAGRLGQQQQEFAAAIPSQVPQPGQSGMGQAQPVQPQGGQGQGGQPGQGPDGGQVAGERPRGGGAPDGGERPRDEIYAPQRIGGEGGEDVDLPSDQPGAATGVEGDFAENPSGEAGVPYTSVWADYSRSVNEALESGYIPLGMRALIRQYFSRLDPGTE